MGEELKKGFLMRGETLIGEVLLDMETGECSHDPSFSCEVDDVIMFEEDFVQ